jgi:predicted patatin/cPLA2 family phospholipase
MLIPHPGTPRRRTALIVEGGAMRGAWAAGVLAFLHERDWRQFDLVYAASSGACSAAYFVAGMLEPGLSIWREWVGGRKLLRKSNCLRLKPLIDLAYLIDHVFKIRVPLSVEAIRNAPTQFHIVLTDCLTGNPVYFHARDERLFDALRASASMPLATSGFHLVDGHPYADGGVADPIPILRAIAHGATDITVVLTHDRIFRHKPTPRWIGRLAYPAFPKVAAAWSSRQHVAYNAALDLIAQPPAGVTVRVFRPMRPLRIRRFTRTPRRLHEALQLGHDDAVKQADRQLTRERF